MHFRVLGVFEVVGQAGGVDLGPPMQRTVLARLLAAQGRVVPVDRLVDDLWHGRPPASATASLQTYVSNLRRVLEPGRPAGAPARVLVTVSPGYALRGDDVDARRFEERVRRALAEHGTRGDRAALAGFEEALALWRGTPYAEFAGARWAAGESARLEELHAMAVEGRAAAAIALGTPELVVADLRAHVIEHPLREEGWRLLALALYRQGRQGDALLALRRGRRALSDELGVDPGPGLRKLEADILAQASVLSAPVSARRAPVRVAATERIFGRDAELAALRRLRGGLALVSGESGAGKSALVAAVAAARADEGWQVATARCPVTPGAPAGWVWTELLRAFAPLGGAAPRIHPSDDNASARFRRRRALAAHLTDLASDAPLLLVLDDLHRADEETLALLVDLTAQTRGSRIVMLATLRTEEADRLTGALAALTGHDVLRLRLGGLDADAARELVTAASGRPISSETLAALMARTSGNPYFLREMGRLIAAEGERAAKSGVPPAVRDLVMRRTARFTSATRGVLHDAAVLGADVDIDVLVAAHGQGEEHVMEAVETALAAGVLAEPQQGGLRFTHPLVRDALYTGMSRLRRTRAQARLTAALQSLNPQQPPKAPHSTWSGEGR
ncbi:BTAD domain-containing putative transcriptional regulator [Actinocorallia sp. A-T 12471]|uniref:BTAD domain-containing putative transcriptional regulator n=1 Tax=Actinocorallia sp. A-T 12471 TaxID=3089813 RepID=UPI0029CBC3A6|nr:BTAD domain-containing putative transcriptional regulator [Actinocorallia sp. A-T 12471]MDX6742660.1 BTAD domain-containing putative transcriptional regulator [Actinocorallia sp. A-T 12471]